jgi:hypothetical protein
MIDLLEAGEEVLEIEGFPGYFITNFGRVFSAPNRMHLSSWIELSKSFKEYFHSTLHKEGKKFPTDIHILVAEAFIPNPMNLPTVNHRDGDKSNNRADNLEWATYSDQRQHALSSGLRQLGEDWGIQKRGEGDKRFSLTMTFPREKKKYIGGFSTKEEARSVRDSMCLEHGLIRPLTA